MSGANPPDSSPEAEARAVIPDKERLRKEYQSKYDARDLTIRDIALALKAALAPIAPSPTIKVRVKDFGSYYRKYVKHKKAGRETPYISDLMGIRIVCPFINDLEHAKAIVHRRFEVVEVEKKGGRYYNEFAYESIHLLVKIPGEFARVRGDTGCDVAEIQIRTILQDAWAEVEHEIFYKAEFRPLDLQRRKLAAVNASLFFADAAFQEIRDYQKNINGQFEERRGSFYDKVEQAADAFIAAKAPSPSAARQPKPTAFDITSSSMDELLLSALTAHNEKQFEDAVTIYSRIIELNQEKDPAIRSLMHKHRGLANFAQSKYGEAMEDFGRAVELNRECYISLYYRGIAHSLLEQYSQALADFNLSLKINPYQPYCLFRRGQAHYHVGDYPRALADCNASLSMEPENETVCRFREMVQARLKM